MSSSPEKLVTPASLLLDAILVIGFFAFMYFVIVPHVPTTDATWKLVWGLLCSSCLSAVFWLCIQMFRVVLTAQIRLNRERVRK